MTLSELINEILSEWAYRVDDGQPNPKNEKHLAELSIVLSEMGLYSIKEQLLENLEEDEKKFTNPILNKEIPYKGKDGSDKKGVVGNLLRLPKEHPGRVAAERLLPPEGSDDRNAMNKDLGSEKDGKSTGGDEPTDKKGDEKPAGEQPKEDPIKKAAIMFDPKSDPAMGARLDIEKDTLDKLAKAGKDSDEEENSDATNNNSKADEKPEGEFKPLSDPPPQNEKGIEKDGKIAGTEIKTQPSLEDTDHKLLNQKVTEMDKYFADYKADKKQAEVKAKQEMGYNDDEVKALKGDGKKEYEDRVKSHQEPTYNLCKVSVPGTNLFCSGNKNIPRDKMPQFKGEPVEGSQAAEVLKQCKESGQCKPDEKEANGEPYFRQMLADKKIKVTDAEVPSESLKATQNELVGDKVLGMESAIADAMAETMPDGSPKTEEQKAKDEKTKKALLAPIYVSRDGYVVDGHHRWAAITRYNMEHPDNPIPLKAMIIDQDIDEAIQTSNDFANEFGVASKSGKQTGPGADVKEPPENEPHRPDNKPVQDNSTIKSMKGESKTFKGKSSGKEIKTIKLDNGAHIFGVQHRNKKMVDDIINQVKSTIPQEKWKDIVFLGEGGATDKNGKMKFNDEQIHAANEFNKMGAGIDSWDGDDLDVHNDQSKLYKKQKEKTGLDDNKVKAGNWASMIGQGEGTDTMNPNDYLDEDGKQFLQDAAKEAGLPQIENWDNPTGEVPNEENPKGSGDKGTLYRLSFPEDNGDKETKINDIQVAFNETRDENILEKTKELQADGKIPITIAGEGHVDLVNDMMKNENLNIKYESIIKQTINQLLLEFISEAPAKKDPLEGKTVKYIDSKGKQREVLVKSALEYDKKHPAYIAAKAFLNQNKSKKQEPAPAVKKLGAGDFRKNPKEKPVAIQQPNTTQSDKSTKVNSIGDAIMANSKQKGDDKKQAFVDKKKDELNKLLGSMGENNKLTLFTEPGGKSITINTLKLGGVIDKVFSGKPLSSEDKKLFNSCLKLVTNPENGDVKIYVAAKYVGRHPQQGYESIKIAQDNVAMGDAIRKYALQNNLNVGKSSEGAIGKKVLTPVKMAASVNPSKPEIVVEIKKTPNGVTIGGKEMKRLKELDYNGLLKSLTPKYGAEEAAKKAKLLVLQTKAYNQKLDDLAKIGEASGGKIPMANFGDVTTPENRKKTASTVLDGIVKRFESELDSFGKQFGKSDLKNTPENKKVFNSLNVLKALNAKANLETDEKARAQYKATLDQLLLDMANAPDFKDSVADFAEQKAGLQFLAEGKQVYFPASENFQTADIIVMPDEFGVKPKKGQTTEEAIAENLQFYSVTVTYVGGLSVKYKGGGGSANYSKIEQTEYHNPETKARLLDMQNVYSLAYPKDKNGQLNIKDADVKAANKKIEDTIQWAIKSKLITKEEADLIRRIGAGQASNTLKGALKDVAKCKGSNRKNFEQSIVLHHTMMHLTAVLNNRDMAYTRFSNFNEEVSQNKDGQATKITDDIADGVNKPCYMNPHHNPGFGTMTDAASGCITGSPTNQNPSHIESEQPKNLLKAPK